MDIYGYWDAVTGQKADLIRGYLRPDAVIRWHNTDEQFTAEEFIRANCEYPGGWEGEIQRAEALGGLTITVTKVINSDTGASFHAVSFIKTEGGLISSVDEYWGDDGPVPDWRREKHIGTAIGRGD